jgi:RHS repeat-associated protein
MYGAYRYGFNGKENDNEVKGAGNQLDFGARVYDSRLGKWLSVDPLTTKYPSLSPYQYALNNPTASVDPDGEDVIRFVTTHTYYSGRESSLDGGVGSIRGYVKTHYQVIIEPAKGPDKFFVDVVKTSVDVHGGFHKDPVQSTQFYPNGDGPGGQGGLFQGTGITESDGMLPWMKRNDEDFTSLAKLAPESLVKYLEKHNPENYGGLGLHQAGLQVGELVKGFVAAVTIIESGLSLNLSSAATSSGRGMANSTVRTAVELGNKVHYDRLNGGPAGSIGLPSELSARFPNTQFRFTSRGAKGADVEVVGGTHPSQYPGSTWAPGNRFGDFKPGSVSGNNTFRADIKSGKLPANTQQLKYNTTTGNLQ